MVGTLSVLCFGVLVVTGGLADGKDGNDHGDNVDGDSEDVMAMDDSICNFLVADNLVVDGESVVSTDELKAGPR